MVLDINLAKTRVGKQRVTAPSDTNAVQVETQKLAAGGLQLEAYALTDDPQWKPTDTRLPKPAAGKHLVVIQAEESAAYQGKQLSVHGSGGSKDAFHYDPASFKPAWAAAPGAEIHIFESGSCRAFKEILAIRSTTTTLCGPIRLRCGSVSSPST